MTDKALELGRKVFDLLQEGKPVFTRDLIQVHPKPAMTPYDVGEAIRVLTTLGLIRIEPLKSYQNIWLTDKGVGVKFMHGGFDEFCKQTNLKANVNYKIVILEYLKEFEGNGIFYNVDSLLLGLGSEQKNNILEDLVADGHVFKQTGTGRWTSPPRRTVSTNHDNLRNGFYEIKSPPSIAFIPYKIKINSKGIDYLESKHKNKNTGINVSGNPGATILVNSPNSVVNINDPQKQTEWVNMAEKIIDALRADQSVSKDFQRDMLLFLAELIDHIKEGKVPDGAPLKVLSIADKVSSVASLGITLATQFLSSK